MFKNRVWKRAAALLLAAVCVFQVHPMEVKADDYWPEGPEVASPAAIVMDMSTGTILYEKNIDETYYPASITKIVTALVALENGNLSDVVTFSDAAIDNTEGSGIARDYGEQMTLEECLYGMMLASSNECAYAIAEHVGGSLEGFVEMMNAKAKELGCTNTHFTNPHGLPDENHYISCRDMATLAAAAYQNETFRIITGTARYSIPPTNKHDVPTDLQNHNEMLYPYKYNKYVYEYCTGGKTGYTTVANSTLVTYAEKDGMSLVCVVMNTVFPNQWTDSKSLFEYCFDNFQLWNISENETNYVSGESIESGSLNENDPFVELDKNACIVLPKTAEFFDAESKIATNEEVSPIAGTITYTYAGHQIGSADIMTTGVKIEGYVFDNQKESEEASEEVSTLRIKPQTIVWIVIGVIVLILLLIFSKYLYDNYYIIRHNMNVRKQKKTQFRRDKKREKRRKRRKRQRMFK